MSEFKLCKNGHYYQKTLAECPYCPKATSYQPNTMNLDQTKIDTNTDDFGLDTTRIVNDANQQLEGATGVQSQKGNLAKTQIFTGNESTAPQNSINAAPPQVGRKLVGWLVSFTIDPNGVDYRLYEGRNSIGSDPACDIVVRNDGAVSGKHLTILFRMGSFKFKDELSTNGTYINGTFEEEGNLKDGDTIKIGNTVFKFRTVA